MALAFPWLLPDRVLRMVGRVKAKGRADGESPADADVGQDPGPGRQDLRGNRQELQVEDWGVVAYDEATARQLELHARRVAGEAPDTLVIVAHPPTFTLGRHAPETYVVFAADELRGRGIAIARTDRGGRATYHGPGQVVLYPIVSIDALGLGVKDWVCLLEGALIDTLAELGITGHRRPATAGIWVGEGEAASKIASLGLRISRGVSYHGVSLNTGLDASMFAGIVTCGVRGERVTTIAAETGRTPDDADVARRLAGHIRRRIEETRTLRRPGGCEPAARGEAGARKARPVEAGARNAKPARKEQRKTRETEDR
jgi:lipoyl(octanoyl) transferase